MGRHFKQKKVPHICYSIKSTKQNKKIIIVTKHYKQKNLQRKKRS